jgi:hypothetical protein
MNIKMAIDDQHIFCNGEAFFLGNSVYSEGAAKLKKKKRGFSSWRGESMYLANIPEQP